MPFREALKVLAKKNVEREKMCIRDSLCAVYHRDLLAGLTALLAAGNYKVMQVITAAAQSRAQAIDVFDVELLASTYPEMNRFSPLPLYRWFHNCNTPEDITDLAQTAFRGE